MRNRLLVVLSCVALGAALLVWDPARAQSVPTYHRSPDRSGNYVMPGLTWERAPGLHRDPTFDGRFEGQVYAQPLLWRSGPTGLLVVATEENVIYAFDAKTGKTVWRRSVGRPVPRSALPCGNIDPLGITGTPVIDEGRRAVYFDAMVAGEDKPRHMIFGLSLGDGSILPGFPVDIPRALKALGMRFISAIQNQRGALLIVNDKLFIPYGGHYGDCGPYHGWVVGIDLASPAKVSAWATRAEGGGIWAPGGISYDGRSMFVATGNTMGAQQWSDGEAVFRLHTDLAPPTSSRDFFAPANWKFMDRADQDLGATNPLPLDVPSANGKTQFVLALGKDGNAYLLNRKDLGGIGGALAVKQIARAPIRTAPASFPAGNAVFVAVQARAVGCPRPVANPDVLALRIAARPSPSISIAWCGTFEGRAAPIVTTTDGSSNPIVWIAGAEGDNRLHGFRGDNGTPIFAGDRAADRVQGVARFSTILAADGRLFIAGDGRLYAFVP
ncbi:MAG TPA: PQQ-binding-like beta-propeller repeat protein [Candidatus Binataceae bacterium]|nr:PQQ-binding-like beta-propeller repeat protein [Candidatus Binataceae bacterium]